MEAITKWIKKSGLKVNESKTELCLFHGNSKPQIMVEVNGEQITSKPSINVLGFDYTSVKITPILQR